MGATHPLLNRHHGLRTSTSLVDQAEVMYTDTRRGTRAPWLPVLTLFVCWPPCSSSAQTMLATIEFRGADGEELGAKNVTLMFSDGTTRFLGTTPPPGRVELDPEVPCTQGMKIKADPDSGWYAAVDKEVECNDPEEVLFPFVDRRYVADAGIFFLLTNVETALKSNDTALEALLYSEASARAEPSDAALARDYFHRSVYAWAEHTDFPGAPLVLYDGVPAGPAFSPSFRPHLEREQIAIGVEPTGSLDYQTLATTADRDVLWFLYDAHTDTASIPLRSQPLGCARPTSVEVAQIESPPVGNLLRAAEKMEGEREYGKAAMLFNEVHARAGDELPLAIYTEQRIYENAAIVLNVTDPVRCDPIQGRQVMTPQMVKAVSGLFEEQPTDKLDYRALRSLAATDLKDLVDQLDLRAVLDW